MMKFYLKPKDPLTLQAIRNLGWVEKISPNNNSVRTTFEKGNYWLTVWSMPNDIPVISFIARDPSLIEFMPDPENFRLTMKCPTVEVFKIITDNL